MQSIVFLTFEISFWMNSRGLLDKTCPKIKYWTER